MTERENVDPVIKARALELLDESLGAPPEVVNPSVKARALEILDVELGSVALGESQANIIL